MDVRLPAYNDRPDWSYWAKLEHLLPSQITCLLLRCDPRSSEVSKLKKMSEYKDIYRLFYQYDASDNLIRQDEMFKYCEECNIKVPTEMLKAYDKLYPDGAPKIPALERKIRNQNIQINRLNAKISKLKSESDSRNITKLLTIFYAMCTDEKYRYNPKNKKNPTTTMIVNATSGLSPDDMLKVSENTVLSWIDRARTRVESEIERVKRKERRMRRSRTSTSLTLEA